MSLRNFLYELESCSRYVTHCPNSGLSNSTKIITLGSLEKIGHAYFKKRHPQTPFASYFSKFILQIAASKQENCVFPNSNLQILSSKSNLRSSFTNLFNFKFSKTCWKSPKLYKRSLTHFQKMSLARWFWAFFFEKKK